MHNSYFNNCSQQFFNVYFTPFLNVAKLFKNNIFKELFQKFYITAYSELKLKQRAGKME